MSMFYIYIYLNRGQYFKLSGQQVDSEQIYFIISHSITFQFLSVMEHSQTEQRATFIAPEMCTECAYHLKCINIERPERLPIPGYYIIRRMGNSKGHNMIEVTQHGRLRVIRSCIVEIKVMHQTNQTKIIWNIRFKIFDLFLGCARTFKNRNILLDLLLIRALSNQERSWF